MLGCVSYCNYRLYFYQKKVTNKDVRTDVKDIPACTQQQTLGKIAGLHAHTCTYTSLMFHITQERETNDAFTCGCLAADCSTCKYCLDRPKFGGKGVKKTMLCELGSLEINNVLNMAYLMLLNHQTREKIPWTSTAK